MIKKMKALTLGIKESHLTVTTGYSNEKLLEWYDRGRNIGERRNQKKGNK